MSRKQHFAERVVELSKNIAQGYMTTEDIYDLIQSENGLLYLHTEQNATQEYSELSGSPTQSINGYLTGKQYDSFDSFKNEMEYADILSQSHFDTEKIFPTVNLKSIAVDNQKRGQGIGSQLMAYAMSMANKNDNYPIISRMWKKANHQNNHIQTAQNSLGGEIIGENTEFLHNLQCTLCEETDCDCSEVYIVFESI